MKKLRNPTPPIVHATQPLPIIPHSFHVYVWNEGSENIIQVGEKFNDESDTFGEYVYFLYEEVEGGIPAYDSTQPIACCIAFVDAQFLARSIVGRKQLGRDMDNFGILRMHRHDENLVSADRNVTLQDRMMEDPKIRKMYENHAKRARKYLKA